MSIKQPIVILGRGRCGTSALAGALRAGGWDFPGKEPVVDLDAGKQWVPGYLEGCASSGNYKQTGVLPIKLRGDETPVLLIRDIDKHARAVKNGLNMSLTHEEAKRSIKEYNTEAMKLSPVVIKFEELLSDPRKVLSQFDVDVDAAAAWIRPEVSIFN